MNLCSRNIAAQFVLAVYLLAGALLEVGHHDIHDIVFDATPVVSSHDCGTTEIHIPLDKRHDCLACSQSTLRVATAAVSLPPNTIAFLCLGHVSPENECTPCTDVLYSGKRGPPES